MSHIHIHREHHLGHAAARQAFAQREVTELDAGGLGHA